MPLPQDHATLCRWRSFVIQRWVDDRNIWFALVEAFGRGLRIRRADFLAIVREYCDQQSENQSYGRRRK